MLRKMIWSILILLMLAIGGTVYLHHQKTLAKYSPELERFVKDRDKHIAAFRRATSGIVVFIQEMISKLRKYTPEMNGKKDIPSAGHAEKTDIFSIFSVPRQQTDTAPEIVYTWVDKRGVRHFSVTKPADSRFKIETIKQ